MRHGAVKNSQRKMVPRKKNYAYINVTRIYYAYIFITCNHFKARVLTEPMRHGAVKNSQPKMVPRKKNYA